MRLFYLSLAVMAGPVWAEEPMSASEFEAYTQGRTFTYAINGQVYGAEEYLSNRRVIWSYVEGQEVVECEAGSWYEDGDQICFVYEHTISPHCWEFWEEEEGLGARLMSGSQAFSSYGVDPSEEPLLCMGPNVGV